MDLQYIGPGFDESGGIVPLPEGWPAFDHDEPRAKVASGKYRAKRPEAPAADAETRGRASRAAAAKED